MEHQHAQKPPLGLPKVLVVFHAPPMCNSPLAVLATKAQLYDSILTASGARVFQCQLVHLLVCTLGTSHLQSLNVSVLKVDLARCQLRTIMSITDMPSRTLFETS